MIYTIMFTLFTMKTIFNWLFILFLTSCVNNNTIDKKIKSISNYSYTIIDQSTEITEVLLEMYDKGGRVTKYSERVKRKYDLNHNLLEEATFSLRNESPFLEHYIKNQYDYEGRLIIKLDSMKMLTIENRNIYDKEGLINSKITTTFFEPKQIGNEENWIPINYSVDDKYYEYENFLNIVTRSIYSESKKSNLEKHQQYDTLTTFHKYDMNQDQVQSVVMSKNDTINITSRRFDSSHNVIEVSVSITDESIDKSEFTYDKVGNLTSSIINSRMYSEKLELSYNENNQLVCRTAYRIESRL